jgi:uridine kinase
MPAALMTPASAGSSERMQELVREDEKFIQRRVDRAELLETLAQTDKKDTLRLVESAEELQYAQVVTFAGESDVFYNLLVPSAGYLKWFDVRRYKNGVLIRFPQPSMPDALMPYRDESCLYDAFSEETRWDRIMGVRTAADLNAKVKDGSYRDLIMLSEALHEKKIADIADLIKQQKKRIVLIAGPSSSGKTSFAKRLCIQLRVNGLRPLYLGTDDYFKERSETPLDENGEKDYESLRAVDTDLFNRDLNDLLAGRKVDIPTFDFRLGTKIFGQRITSIDASQPIVIEGIHALNRGLTEHIEEAEKFRIYISPLTQLNIDDHNRISTTDARMLRRMVRDYQFRGHDVRDTIDSWPKVRAGEEKYIFPYDNEGDVFFNSQCLYELSVLKKYAKPLLEEVQPGEPQYAEASRMLSFLEFFETIEDDAIIPNNSIMREFIGGSVLVH